MPGDVITLINLRRLDPQYVNAAPELRERIGNEVGSEGVKLLKGGGSFWPVRTGNSKRAFNFTLEGYEVAYRNRRSYAKLRRGWISGSSHEGISCQNSPCWIRTASETPPVVLAVPT